MAEFVEQRIEDMIPELEQMERIKLFEKAEIRGIAKKRKEYEYKIQRHTKCKEDYLKYIQYELDLLKLVKQRREKLGNTLKKTEIDYAIINKINNLYKSAISKFEDDLRFWIAYMAFCKSVKYHGCISRMIGRMLQVHQDKPKCWHIAARWEMEENKNIGNARQFLLKGLMFHPESQILYADLFKLELETSLNKTENTENDEELPGTSKEDLPKELKKAHLVFQQAFQTIKDVKFVVNLINIVKDLSNTEKLQSVMVSEMLCEYPHESLMWDTMARRELEGLAQPVLEGMAMEVDNPEPSSPRDRIEACVEVYQTAVKTLKSEEMWSHYIDCLIEINQDTSSLPNFKKRLLKSALSQGHQAKKLKEKYYIYWIEMFKTDKKQENAEKKLEEILTWATEAVPTSINLWTLRLKHYLTTNQEEVADSTFEKAVGLLGNKCLPLWKMKLLFTQAKNPEKVKEVFQAALKSCPEVVKEMKPLYIEWLVLKKNIQAARKEYQVLAVQPPLCLELHQKMATLELMRPDLSLKHARKPHELATLQFGKSNTDVWINYITFEIEHGEPKLAGELHARAVKWLDAGLVDKFISDYALLKTNLETSNSKEQTEASQQSTSRG